MRAPPLLSHKLRVFKLEPTLSSLHPQTCSSHAIFCSSVVNVITTPPLLMPDTGGLEIHHVSSLLAPHQIEQCPSPMNSTCISSLCLHLSTSTATILSQATTLSYLDICHNFPTLSAVSSLLFQPIRLTAAIVILGGKKVRSYFPA